MASGVREVKDGAGHTISHMARKCGSNDAPKMSGCRSRNDGNGRMRGKRSDTHVGTIEKQYGVDLGARSDMHLGTLLKREGAASLSDLLDKS